MHIVIMGCGRVGSTLAHHLERLEHSVAVIDQNPIAFRRLGEHFAGREVEGVGFDRETLMTAGIEQAAAFAAVVGEARELSEPDQSQDAVLLFGPLYHLTEPAHRRQALGETRRINVYTPPGYDAAPGVRYPVLYMPDG